MPDARDAYTLALNLCQNERERAFLLRRLAEVSGWNNDAG
jgi:predicted RNA polymerase sigma factor